MKHASQALDCIGCMACYSACPVIGLGDLTDFAGPAPLVQLAQTALDPRNDSERSPARSARPEFSIASPATNARRSAPPIPIVSGAIEPLKARAAVLVPAMARHSQILHRIVAARGRVDPGALVLGVQGLSALRNFPRMWRMLMRGKINPLRTLLGLRTAAARPARRLLRREGANLMKFAYYPGCSARSTCAELNEATHRVAARLGLDLIAIESATCTGARELRAIDP